MQTPPRTPPRFVPTLTEVVQHVPVSASTLAPLASPAPYSDDASGQGGWPDADPPLPPVPDFAARASPPDILATEALEDQIIHRVMQRVDLSLERRLQDAVSAMVLAQTQLLVPRLREEIEFVVRQSVSDAVADELATRSPR
jgi:hypothetical protein